MASPTPPHQPMPGSSFYPQNYDLVMQYLLPKLAGSPLPASTEQFFHNADVYADDPETLTSRYPSGPARAYGESRNWYFFCPVKPTIARDGRKPRIVGGGKGTWKAERGETVVDPSEGDTVGRLERFTYMPKPKEAGKRPEWLMVEFSLDQQLVGDDEEPRAVLCKIYRSPRFLNSVSKSLASSASARKCKRKAADERPASPRKSIKATDESSPVRRQLLFPSPIAPILQAPILEDDEAFLGDDQFWSEHYRIGELSDPTPNRPVQVDDLGEQFWSGLAQLDGGEPSAPWSCSKMTATSTPLCGGADFFWNSIATL
ncbi:hypothetical protein ACQ4PT_006871 [Festuca glaucescens]